VPDIISDGNVKVSWVTTIADVDAPTSAELTAGTVLTAVLTPSGLIGFEPDTAEIDSSSMASRFNTKLPGRTNYSGLALELKKQSGTDTVFALLDTKDTRGYLVIRRGEPQGDAFAAADVVEVYPAATGQYFYMPPEENSMVRYRVPITITDEPNLAAVVA
jgi:hypothetical protein